MADTISIRTVKIKGKPALELSIQTVHADGAVVSLVALNGSLLRLVAVPDGESVILLEKTQEAGLHIKIETSHQTILRRIDMDS